MTKRTTTLIVRSTSKHGVEVSAVTYMAAEMAEIFPAEQRAELERGEVVVHTHKWGQETEWLEITHAAKAAFDKPALRRRMGVRPIRGAK